MVQSPASAVDRATRACRTAFVCETTRRMILCPQSHTCEEVAQIEHGVQLNARHSALDEQVRYSC